MGCKLASLILPEALPTMIQTLENQLKHGSIVQYEMRISCKSGLVKWIALKAELIEKDGEEQLFCVFLDTTEEQRLRERNRELYEQELAYFTRLSSAEGSCQGTFNVSQNRLERYVSVSYTHLDVYKRQGQSCGHSSTCGAGPVAHGQSVCWG